MDKKNIEGYKKVIYIFIGVVIILFTVVSLFISKYTKKVQTKLSEINTNSNISENEIEQASSELTNSIDDKNTISIVDETLKKSSENNNKKTSKSINASELNENKIAENKESEKVNIKKENVVTKQASSEENKQMNLDFIMPVDGEIIKGYAKDNLIYSNTLEEWTTHLGIDIKAPKTTIVKASEKGIVKSIKNDPRYGITVIIEHANGFESQYSNLLTAEFVKEGEEVKKGQTIGTVGNTAIFEIEDDMHLHFELRKDNQNVDPNVYIK